MRRRLILCLMAVLFFNGIVYGGDVLKLGVDTPLTGSGASPGHYLLWGFQIAVDEVNAKGGVLGKKVEGIIMDDETDPQRAVGNIRELVYDKKVPAVLGPVNSGNAVAFIPILQKEHIPVVLLISTAAKLTKIYEKEPENYIFRSALPDSGQPEVLVRWAVKKFKKIGIAADSTGYGKFGRESLLEMFKKYKSEPAEMVEFDLGDMNMTSQMEKLKKAGADAVAVYSLGPEIAELVRSADKISYHPVFFGPWTFFHHSIFQLPKRLSNGMVGVLALTPYDGEKAKEIDRIVREKYVGDKYYPFTFVAVAYEGTKLMLEAIEKAGSADGEKIRDALENIENFQGVSKIFTKPFSKSDHELYNADDMFLGVWKDGKVVRLEE